MPKTNSTPLNYPALFFSTIKEKYISFSLGFIVFLVVSIILFQYALINLKPLTSKIQSKEKVQSKEETKREKNEVRTYTVKTGDQLFLIAEKFYGSGLNMEDILKTNNLSDPNLIEVGQKLIIPDVKPKYPTTGQVTDTGAKTGKVTLKEEKYIVKQGDSLASIALQAYGDSYSWTKIAKANNLSSPDDLEVGKTLIIPK